MRKKQNKRHVLLGFIGIIALIALTAAAASVVADKLPPNTRVPSEIAASPTTALPPDSTRVLLDVPYLSQEGFPTGCESATAVMLLRAHGVEMTLDEFVDEHLDCATIRSNARGLVAPHPAQKFVGDPRSKAAYGCFAPVIIRALNSCVPQTLRVADESGSSLSDLCARYIDHGQPVAVWATMGMKPSYDGNTWTLPNGERFTWVAREHCLLLVGYDKQNYFFHDPLTGASTPYPRNTAETRYHELGEQAIALCPAN